MSRDTIYMMDVHSRLDPQTSPPSYSIPQYPGYYTTLVQHFFFTPIGIVLSQIKNPTAGYIGQIFFSSCLILSNIL